MCQQQKLKVIRHTNTTDVAKILNQSQIHLNKYETWEFTKIFKNFLCNINLFVNNSDDSNNYVLNSVNFFKDMLYSDHNKKFKWKLWEEPILFSEYKNNNDDNW